MPLPGAGQRTLLQTLLLVATALLLSACAATVSAPQRPDPGIDWSQAAELPPAIHASLQGSSLQQVPTDDGVSVPVRSFGAGGARTPLLMVHGLQSHSGWFSQSAAFVARLGHPVYVIDRRGSGLSQAARGDSKDFHQWSADIRAVAELAMTHHNHDRVLLLGHCFGAIPATVYAETAAETVKGLILTTPGIFTHTSIPISQTLKIATTGNGRRNYYFPVPLDPVQFSELREYAPFIASDPLALRAVTGDLYWQIHQARKHIRRNSHKLTMPILVGFAGEDEIADNARNRTWLAGVPSNDKTEIVYPDARHILEYSVERAHYFADLQHWLDRIERH